MSEEKTSILLLCSSSEVAESVLSILDSDYEVIRAKTLTQSFEILDSKRPPIAILDFAAATSMNGDTIKQLKKHKPELVTLLVCPRDKRDQLLESNLSNETYRVLFATLSPGQTRLAVAASLKHAKAKASEMPVAKKPETRKQKVAKPKKARPTSAPTSKKSSSKLIPIIAGIALLTLGGIGWMFMSGDKTEKKTSTPIVVEVEKTPAQLEAEALSVNAKASFDSGILFPPDENNALDSYSKILQLDPNNFNAKKALLELSQSALGDVDLHIQNGSIEEAQASIDFARGLAIDKPAFLELIENSINEKKSTLIASVEDSLASGLVTDAASLIGVADKLFSDDENISGLKASITEQQKSLDQASEISNLLTRSREAINTNRLLAPNRNNAQYFINRLEALDPGNSAIAGLKRNLSSSLLLEARTAALNSDFTNAKRYVDSAARLGASSAAITNERQRITSLESSVREQEQLQKQAEIELAEQQLQVETNRLAQEQADAEAAAAIKAEEERQAEIIRLSTVPVDVVIGDLTSIIKTPPNYPDNYQRRSIDGSAVIALTVEKDGSVNNVRIVSVEPETRKLFGSAALEAVQTWSFQPYKDEDGNVRIANTQVRIVFQL